MGKSTPSPPPAPDPVATAQAQAAANQEAAIASQELGMVGQITPFGTLTFEQTGTSESGTPQYTATQTLSDEQQAIADVQQAVALQYGQTAQNQLGQVTDMLGQPVDFSGLGDAPTPDEAFRQQTLASMMARQQPEMDRRRSQLQTELAGQGFMPGTEGYNTAMDEMMRRETDLQLAADVASGAEMQRQYGMQSTARDRAINEMMQLRTQPLNELAAMMTGSQVQGPQFVNTPSASVAPADVMGATYGSANLAQQNYAQQMAQQNAQAQGLYSLLGTGAQAAFMFSDRRLKRGIKKIGELVNGLGLYTYRYVWGGPRHIGLMADEVKAVKPWAVKEICGYDAVNYAEAIR